MIATGAGSAGIGHLQASAAIARHIQREADNIVKGLSVVTGLPIAAPAKPVPDDLQAVNDAIDTLTPDQHRRMLLFLAGYDTPAVVRSIDWIRSRDTK